MSNPNTFSAGQELTTRFIGDSESILRATVIKRTAKRITLKVEGYAEPKTVGILISPFDNGEVCYPLGRYSMAPTFRAGDKLIARPGAPTPPAPPSELKDSLTTILSTPEGERITSPAFGESPAVLGGIQCGKTLSTVGVTIATNEELSTLALFSQTFLGVDVMAVRIFTSREAYNASPLERGEFTWTNNGGFIGYKYLEPRYLGGFVDEVDKMPEPMPEGSFEPRSIAEGLGWKVIPTPALSGSNKVIIGSFVETGYNAPPDEPVRFKTRIIDEIQCPYFVMGSKANKDGWGFDPQGHPEYRTSPAGRLQNQDGDGARAAQEAWRKGWQFGESLRPTSRAVDPKPLNCAMDNVTASMLGEIALNAGDPLRGGCGDKIDRGLVLNRLLNEAGFCIVRK